MTGSVCCLGLGFRSPGTQRSEWQPVHKDTHNLQAPTPAVGSSVSGSTSATLTGNGLHSQPTAISRQLLVSLLPCARPGVVPLGSTPKVFSGLRGDRMVDMIAKLTRRQSRALKAQVGMVALGGNLSLSRQQRAVWG